MHVIIPTLPLLVKSAHKYTTMLFNANKYTRWYYDIVHRAETRTLLSIGEQIA